MIIKNENHIYTYFQIIKELQPLSVLDAGMFLKRVGSVARQMMNCEVPKEVRLDGIDFFPEVQFPIWEMIYDKRYNVIDLSEVGNLMQYDLGIVLGSEDLVHKVSLKKLFWEMEGTVSWFLTDAYMREQAESAQGKRVQNIMVEGEVYYLMDCRKG